ncbi:MAG: hypothetical protein KDD28_15260 [Phaeodactylibacter sp.]|nr:hypothetical protein [Phaeodactylibacter sp.]
MNKAMQKSSVLEVIRENRVELLHVFGLGLRADGQAMSDGEVQRRYNSLCSYVSQTQQPGKKREAILRRGLEIYARQLMAEIWRLYLEDAQVEAQNNN